MAKILAISSQTVFGPVGNSAAVPALQSLGHEVLQLPTILLSHHPGHGKPVAERFTEVFLKESLEGLASKGMFSDLGAIMTGYFASAKQVTTIASALQTLPRPPLILVDPVMGDDGALYVAQDVAQAIRTELVPLATILTPNVFELGWLTNDLQSTDYAALAKRLPAPEILISSVPAGEKIGTLLVQASGLLRHHMARLPDVPHGTGDYLAGLYLGHRLQNPPDQAFIKAMLGLEAAVKRSAGKAALLVT